MKIRPNEAMAPLHRPEAGICDAIAADDSGGLPKTIDTAIKANAIRPAGNSPAMNRPPIDRVATKPRMMQLLQGGKGSAVTAEAASSATALTGFCRERRAAGISTDPPAATSA